MAERYISLFELGSGAFGQAFVVKDKVTDAKYVTKVMQIRGLSSTDLDRCVTEVAVLSACRHVNIVRYIQAFISEGCLHIVMEYATGGDLAQKIKKQNGTFFPKEVILNWFVQVILALEYIHSKHILHRDLKPQNIFLTYCDVVKLGDFGIAKVLCSKEDLASTRIGTPYYISPEICERKTYNSKTDMWASGCLLYEMCCLHVPFQAPNLEQLMGLIVKGKYTPLPNQFGLVLPMVLSKLLVINPSERLFAKEILALPQLTDLVLVLRKRNSDLPKSERSRSLCRERPSKLHPERSASANKAVQPGTAKQSDNLARIAHPSDKDQTNTRNTEQRSRSPVETAVCERNVKDKEIKAASPVVATVIHQTAEKSTYKGPVDTGRSESPVLKGRTYSVKDSMMRKWSAASPKLSQTIYKQRFSLSVSEAGSCSENKGNNSIDSAGYEEIDEVFSPSPSFKQLPPRLHRGSDTYRVCVGDKMDSNKNEVSGDSSHISATLVHALSVFTMNKELAKKLLMDDISAHTSSERAMQIVKTVKHLVVDGGQSFATLQEVLGQKELSLLPLISMYMVLQ